MLTIGDVVVHPRYGPALIEEIRIIQYRDEPRRYFCLRLTQERDKSVVMIPEDSIDGADLRTTLMNARAVQKIMRQQPVALDEDFRVRQKYISTQMHSNDPQDLVGLLRDLCWYAQDRRLSQAETKSRNELLAILQGELSVSQQISPVTAEKTLDAIIDAAMELHLASVAPAG